MTLIAYNEHMDQLEAMVDATSFIEMVEMLANVAGEKAEHLRENWQDENSAEVYDNVEGLLIEALVKLHKVDQGI